MSARVRTPLIVLVTAVVALVLGILWGGHPESLPGFLRSAFVKDDVAARAQVADDIKGQFYKKVSDTQLEQASLKGMVDSLHDRFSEYFTPAEAKQFAQSLSGQFEGVGMSVDSRDTKKGLKVAKVFMGSPAQKAGIKAGDVIVAVNGKSIVGESADLATGKIRGPAGTKVTLAIRGSGGATRSVTLERKQIAVPLVVSSSVQRGGRKLAVVRLAEFGSGAHVQVRQQIDKQLKAGARGIVFDLRGNPGGELEEGVLVSSIFLQRGQLVVSTHGRTSPEQKLYATGGAIDPGVPVVVLVDGNSASAAEITTGALRDNARATVVGEKTFGKGVFQSVDPLHNGGLLKLTAGEYFLPKGENLGGHGIVPPVKAKDDPKTKRDEALPVALRILRSQVR